MERAEKIGLGVAAAAHVALFAALSVGLVSGSDDRFRPKPLDVQLVDEIGLEDTAPDPALVDPATSIAPELGVPEDETAELEPVERMIEPAAPTSAPKEVAPPPPKAKPKPAPKPKKAQPKGSRLGDNFLKGISSDASLSKSQKPTAGKAGPAVVASLQRELLRQLKPHWKAPTGADAELLRTELSIQLNEDGRVIGTPRVLRTTGVNSSNRAQAKLHAERAIRAVRLASPFNLPPKYYDTWKLLEPIGFDKRLSQ